MPAQIVRLYRYIQTWEPGRGVSLAEMGDVTNASDQAVRSMLTQIRHGRVGHPDEPGYLPAIPVYYDKGSRLYYRSDRLVDANVIEGVPQNIQRSNTDYVLSRVRAIREAFVPGLQHSLEARLISDPVTIQLLQGMGEQQLIRLVQDSTTLLSVYSELRNDQLRRLAGGDGSGDTPLVLPPGEN